MADKEYVLSEIRRTAKANGGLPLGSKRFTDETGIRDIDWRGKYWARWGDALVEAGFSPNQFQGAYPDEFLLEKLAALTLELGHFPVVTEMKMKAHRDPDFPNPKTIRRLGGRNQLMAKLSQFSQSHPEYEAVGRFCAPVEEQQSKSSSQPLKHIRISGEVYLLKSGKYYKSAKRTRSVVGSMSWQSNCPRKSLWFTQSKLTIRLELKITGTGDSRHAGKTASGLSSHRMTSVRSNGGSLCNGWLTFRCSRRAAVRWLGASAPRASRVASVSAAGP